MLLTPLSYSELHHMKLLPFQTNYSSQCSIVVSFSHDSIYLAGCYNKYSRTLSQTPWILDGVRKADTSIQDLIYIYLQPALRCETVRFSSSCRKRRCWCLHARIWSPISFRASESKSCKPDQWGLPNNTITYQFKHHRYFCPKLVCCEF